MRQVPRSLLLDPALEAAHKVLWLTLSVAPAPLSVTKLAAGSGLTRHTVRRGLARLAAAGWYTPQAGAVKRSPTENSLAVPNGLLTEPRLRPQAKLLYAVLQTIPGETTYAELAQAARVSVVTVRQCLQELAETGWVRVEHPHKFAPVRFTLQEPDLPEVALAKKRLEDATYNPEAVMKEYLSLLIDSDEFEDNARPGFLVNPLTNERMELDRYYPRLAVGFEYNGAQHFRTTKRFPSEQKLTMQQARDLMKEAICARRGIRIIVITRADLNLSTMRKKVARVMPLRSLDRHQSLIAFLEQLKA